MVDSGTEFTSKALDAWAYWNKGRSDEGEDPFGESAMICCKRIPTMKAMRSARCQTIKNLRMRK